MAFASIEVRLENRTSFHLIRAHYELEANGVTGPHQIGPGQTGSWGTVSPSIFWGGVAGAMQYAITGPDGSFLSYCNTHYDVPMVGSNEYWISVSSQNADGSYPYAKAFNGGMNTKVRFVLEGTPGAFVVKVFPQGTIEVGEVSSGTAAPDPGDGRFAALLRSGGGAYLAVPDWDWDSLHGAMTEHAKDGLLPVSLDTFVVDGAECHAAVLREGTGDYDVVSGWAWEHLYDQIGANLALGLVPVDVSVRVIDGEPRYDMVFREGTGGAVVVPDWDWPAMWDEIVGNHGNGLRMTAISAFEIGGEVRYAGVFRPGSGPQSVVPGWSWNALYELIATKAKKGMSVTDVSPYTAGGETRYAAILRPEPGSSVLLPNWDWPSVYDRIVVEAGKGRFPVVLASCR